MFAAFLRNILRGVADARPAAVTVPAGAGLRLHVGGTTPHPDWKILDVGAAPHVDFVGHCADLGAFADGSVAEIYASHVLEHLGFKRELPAALGEFHRVLVPGGVLHVSVPDLAVLCALYVDPALAAADRYQVMRMLHGGQLDPADFHHAGFDETSLGERLRAAGFTGIARVDHLGLFEDSSLQCFKGRPISLNMRARKA